jgi:hypothetical protein
LFEIPLDFDGVNFEVEPEKQEEEAVNEVEGSCDVKNIFLILDQFVHFLPLTSLTGTQRLANSTIIGPVIKPTNILH